MRLYLLRHGRPDVAAGICYGSTDLAVPAAEQERVIAALAAQLPAGVPLWTSPARRCAGLAEGLASALGAPAPRPDERLREMDFGAWEMREWDQIARAEVEAWAADLLHYRPGGGECVLQVAQRLASFHADLESAGTGQAILVCHAGAIRLLSRLHGGACVEDAALLAAAAPHRIAYGELVTLG